MAFCRFCGAETQDGNFCPSCGARVKEETPSAPAPVRESRKPLCIVGLLGMIFGIAAYVFLWVPALSICIGIAAVALSGIGMAKSEKYRLKGFAIAGLACGIVAVIIALAYIIVILLAEIQPVYYYYGNMY